MNPNQHNESVNIPIELISFAAEHKIINTLKVMIAAKLICPGHVGTKDKYFERLCLESNLKPRTIKKHLDKLCQLKWVSHDINNDVYYFRSYAWFRKKMLIIKRSSISANLSDLNHFQAFLLSGTITKSIDAQIHINNLILSKSEKLKRHTEKKSKKSATIISGVASQDQSFTKSQPHDGLPYYGLSNAAIGKLFFLNPTRACELKKEAEANGYLKTTKRFHLIDEYSEKVPDLIKKYYKGNGTDKKNIRVRSIRRNDKWILQLVEQLHDEITPLIKIKQINYHRLMKQEQVRNTTSKFRCKVAVYSVSS